LLIKGLGKIPISDDIMLMGTAYDLAAPHGLKAMAMRYLGVEDWDIKKKDKTSTDLSVIKPYLMKDIQYTWELYVFFHQVLSEVQWSHYKKLLKPAYLMYRDIEREGVYIDKKKLEEVKETYKKEQYRTLGELKKHYDINWNSTKQVPDVLFNKEGLPPQKLSQKTGNPSADSKTLKRLAAMGHELPQKLLDYKFYFGANSKFLNSWGDYAAYDGRIHPSFNITNVRTGRTSCSDPNLQQVPRNKELRTLYTAPKGYSFIEADYSQLELRIAAVYANDPVMLKIYREGGDIHSATAESLAGTPDFTKDDRTKAKPVNFGFLYGMYAKGFVEYAFDNYGVTFTQAEAERYRQLFFMKYPRLLHWHSEMEDICEALGGVENMFGRFRALPDIHSRNRWERGKAVRCAINTPVQSTGSDILLFAASEIHKVLKKDLGVKLVGTVHDAILAEVPDEYLEDAIPEIRRIMMNPKGMKDFGVKLPIPLEVDVGVGAWGAK
jgi:DNA polymerase-1